MRRKTGKRLVKKELPLICGNTGCMSARLGRCAERGVCVGFVYPGKEKFNPEKNLKDIAVNTKYAVKKLRIEDRKRRQETRRLIKRLYQEYCAKKNAETHNRALRDIKKGKKIIDSEVPGVYYRKRI